MNHLPPDHPLRLELADEVHARPPEPVGTPCRATYVALLVNLEDRQREHDHLAALCRQYGKEPPGDATQYSAQLGPIRVKWERHGEFSGLTLLTSGLSPKPFSEPVADLLPSGWLEAYPGTTIVAAHAKLMAFDGTPPDGESLAAWFNGNVVVGGMVGEGVGAAFTDFKVHADGFGRFVVCNRGLTERQAGRTLQRLFEIETYRTLALLALPIARELLPTITRLEQSLSDLTARIAEGGADEDEALLNQLTHLAAEIERALSTSQFRFGACRAYHQLVTTRIEELRESRLPGVQPISEFMARRLSPAVATCASAAQRLRDLSERVAQGSALLSTRVDIARERQNQQLLSSMDRRAKMQLRLQQTVEGLSVAAIVYYLVGLLSYLAKAGKAAGLPLNPDLAAGLALPVTGVAVLWALHRARRRMREGGPHLD